MKRTEDDIRAALRVLADDAPDASAILSALRSAAKRGASGGRGRPRRVARVIAPLGAAIAVTAVVVTAVAVGSAGHRGRGHHSTGALNTATPTAGARGVPQYYLAITVPPGQSGIVTTVRDARTGAVLGTVHPPRGYWFVAADRGNTNDSFLLEANQHGGPPGLFLLQFNPADRSTSLTKLPIALGPYPTGLALSPSGTEVAVAGITNTGARPAELQIYSLSGSLVRQWQSPGAICADPGVPCLSWSASGRLAFLWNNNGTNLAAEGIRLIPAAAASGSLVGASHLTVPLRTFQGASFAVSGNGTTISAEVKLNHSGTAYRFENFSAAAGKLTGLFPRVNAGVLAYWSNSNGSELIVSEPFPAHGQYPPQPLGRFGILTDRRFTPLADEPEGQFLAIAF